MHRRRRPCLQSRLRGWRARLEAPHKPDRALGPASASTRPACPKRRPARESWWSVRRVIGRSLAHRFFSRASAVLMSAHDGGVNHHVFVSGVARQKVENSLENSGFCPSAVALMYDLPVAETRRQVTPGNSGSIPIKNCIDEQSVVRCGASDMTFSARQKILDPLPLVVSQSKALHGSALREADCPAVLALTSNPSAASRREAPPSTSAITRPRMS